MCEVLHRTIWCPELLLYAYTGIHEQYSEMIQYNRHTCALPVHVMILVQCVRFILNAKMAGVIIPYGVLVPTGTVHSNNEFEFEFILLNAR